LKLSILDTIILHWEVYMRMSNEARVGFMVMISFTLFVVLVGILTKFNISQKGYRIHVYFGFLNDLRVGAPVKIAGGIKIGYVDEIRQTGEKTDVVVWIDKGYRLSKAATFSIFTSGVIGEKYINVVIPPLQEDIGFLKEGDIKYGIDPASFDQMLQTFQSFMQDKSGAQILAEIFQNSNKFVANLNKMVDENRYDVRQSVGTARTAITTFSQQLQQFMQQMNVISKNMAYISEKNREDITITLQNLSELTTSINKIAYRLEKGRGTMGKFLYDEEIYTNIRDASISAKELFSRLEKDPSLLLFKQKK